MSEFISRKDALEHLCAACFISEDQCLSKCWQRIFIEKIPAADVVPMDFHERCLQIEVENRLALEKKYADVRSVKRGEWVDETNKWSNGFRCSQCGHKIFCGTTNFCPNCGADMREEET